MITDTREIQQMPCRYHSEEHGIWALEKQMSSYRNTLADPGACLMDADQLWVPGASSLQRSGLLVLSEVLQCPSAGTGTGSLPVSYPSPGGAVIICLNPNKCPLLNTPCPDSMYCADSCVCVFPFFPYLMGPTPNKSRRLLH